MVSGITYNSYPKAKEIVEFNFATQTLVSKLRTAQAYGSNVGGEYVGAGVLFTKKPSSRIQCLACPPKSKSYTSTVTEFLDASGPINKSGLSEGDKVYSGSGSRDLLLSEEILGPMDISKICYTPYRSTSIICDENGRADMFFTYSRLDTNTKITSGVQSDNSNSTEFHDVGYVELKSNKLTGGSAYRCIEVYKSGAIEIKNSICPQ